jgi:hypothetical protein
MFHMKQDEGIHEAALLVLYFYMIGLVNRPKASQVLL